MNNKKLEKLIKAIGPETATELESLSAEELKARIVVAEMAVKAAQDELEANPKYQELREGVKALSEGFKEVRKRQKGITQYSLQLLEEKGQSNE